jgi:Flp pilus assembly pilin Flp
MQQRVISFLRDERGAITVDWVVLTAAAVGLGLIVITQIGGSTENVGTTIGAGVAALEVGYENLRD